MGAVKKAMMEAEQNAFDAYSLGDITRAELIKRLEHLNFDHYEATEAADMIDHDLNPTKPI